MHEGFVKAIEKYLQEELLQASEDIIKKAVAEYEAQVRKKIANAVMAAVKNSYRMDVRQDELVITVKRTEV